MKRAWPLLAVFALSLNVQAGFDARATPPSELPAAVGQDALQAGLIYYRRALVDGQFAMAVHQLRQAVAHDDPVASLALAYLLAVGKGVEADGVRAQQLLDRLPMPLLARAAYVRGHIALTHGDARVAARDSVAWWECAASMGDTLALHRLGTERERARAYADARRLYALAEADGFPPAASNAKRLARVESETPGVNALASLRRRARSGDVVAQFELGRAHHRGTHMPVNVTAALQLYQRAARGGHEPAARMAQLMLLNRQRSERLDYAWIARLAWSEPHPALNALTPSAARQAIQQERDPLWQVEALMKSNATPPLCELYVKRGAGNPAAQVTQ
jgi:TPR repeat protein